jgi:hypothetical protein
MPKLELRLATAETAGPNFAIGIMADVQFVQAGGRRQHAEADQLFESHPVGVLFFALQPLFDTDSH